MEMNVMDRLPAVRTRVHDGPIPLLGHTLCLSQVTGHDHEISEHIPVMIISLCERRDVLRRDDENVGRRLWSDVPKRDDPFVPVDNLSGNITRDDLAKETVDWTNSSGGLARDDWTARFPSFRSCLRVQARAMRGCDARRPSHEMCPHPSCHHG